MEFDVFEKCGTKYYQRYLVFCFNIACVFIVVIPVVQMIQIRKTEGYERFFIIFAIVHNLEFLIIAIFLGFGDRYLISFLFVSIILTGNYIYKLNGKCLRYISFILLSVVIVVASLDLLDSGKNYKEIIESHEKILGELQKRNVAKGYTSKEHAYTIQGYSNDAIKMGAVVVGEKTSAIMWLVDSDVYNPTDGARSYFMLTEDEYQKYGEAVTRQFGDPEEIFEIEDVYLFNEDSYTFEKGNVYTYIFNYDIASLISNNLFDKKLEPKELFFNGIGSINQEFILLDNGGIVHGPYCKIQPGEYTVEFIGSNLENTVCDVYTDEYQDNIEFEEVSRNENDVVLYIKVSKIIEDIQFRVFNNDDTQVVVKEILVY